MNQSLSLEQLYPDVQKLRVGSALYMLLKDTQPQVLRQRKVLNDVLLLAESRNWIDTEALGRLRAGDDAVVMSILDELTIARWMLQAGYDLFFNPPGSGKHIGELLISSDHHQIWMEAKSLLPSNADIVAQSTYSLLDNIAQSIPVAARLVLEISHYPGGGVSTRELRRYLWTSATQLLDHTTLPPAYTHPSGLYLRPVSCIAEPEASRLIIDVVDDLWPGQEFTHDRLWRERLWRTLRGGYTQLPLEGPPTFILVVDHCQPYHPISDWLYPFHDLLRMGQHRNLSAIGRLLRRDLWLDEPRLTLFLNPYARITFPEEPISQFPEQRISILKS